MNIQTKKIAGEDYLVTASSELRTHKDSLTGENIQQIMRAFPGNKKIIKVAIASGILKTEDILDLLQENHLELDLCESALDACRSEADFITALINKAFDKSSYLARKLLRPVLKDLSKQARQGIAQHAKGDPGIFKMLAA